MQRYSTHGLYLEAQAKAGGQAPFTLNPGLRVPAGHSAVGHTDRKDLGLPRHIIGLGEYGQGLSYGITCLKVERGKGLSIGGGRADAGHVIIEQVMTSIVIGAPRVEAVRRVENRGVGRPLSR